MTSPTITLRDVKCVRVMPSIDITEKSNREIEIELEDGSRVTIELWTNDNTLKLEIM